MNMVKSFSSLLLLITALVIQSDAATRCGEQRTIAHRPKEQRTIVYGPCECDIGLKRTREQSQATDPKDVSVGQDTSSSLEQLTTLRNQYIKAVKMLLIVCSFAAKVNFDEEVNGETWNGCWRDWRFYGARPSEWLIKSVTRSMNTLLCLDSMSEIELLTKFFNLNYGLSLIASTIVLPEAQYADGWRQVVDLYRVDPVIESSYIEPSYSSEEIDKIRILVPGFSRETCNLVAKLFCYIADVKAVNRKFIKAFKAEPGLQRCLSNQVINGSSVHDLVLVQLPKCIEVEIARTRSTIAAQKGIKIEEQKQNSLFQRLAAFCCTTRKKTVDPDFPADGNTISLLDDDAQEKLKAIFFWMING